LSGAAVAFLLMAGVGCFGRGPSTHVMVFNLSMSSFTVNGRDVEVGFSRGVYAAHGVVDTLELKRGTVVGRLVITSLLPSGDPSTYDAAINVHEDTPGVLYCREFSPCIDAVIVAP
jgi:hypothetical protein